MEAAEALGTVYDGSAVLPSVAVAAEEETYGAEVEEAAAGGAVAAATCGAGPERAPAGRSLEEAQMIAFGLQHMTASGDVPDAGVGAEVGGRGTGSAVAVGAGHVACSGPCSGSEAGIFAGEACMQIRLSVSALQDQRWALVDSHSWMTAGIPSAAGECVRAERMARH